MWSWIIIGFAVLVVGALLLFLTFIFAAALVEKRRIMELIPLPDSEAPASAKARSLDEQAKQAGLLFMGAYRDTESALATMNLSIYLSEDGRVMMVLPSLARAHGYRLYTQMADGMWLVSGQVVGNSDLSGLQQTAMLSNGTLADVLAFHRDRVNRYESDPVPFAPETLVENLAERDRAIAEATVARGFARWVDRDQTVWRCNLRGACQLVQQTLGGMASV